LNLFDQDLTSPSELISRGEGSVEITIFITPPSPGVRSNY
jgi:hypothetical protein